MQQYIWALMTKRHLSWLQKWLGYVTWFFLSNATFIKTILLWLVLQLQRTSKRRKLDSYCSSTFKAFKETGIYNLFMSNILGLLPPNFRFLWDAVMLGILLRRSHSNEVQILVDKVIFFDFLPIYFR